MLDLEPRLERQKSISWRVRPVLTGQIYSAALVLPKTDRIRNLTPVLYPLCVQQLAHIQLQKALCQKLRLCHFARRVSLLDVQLEVPELSLLFELLV